MPTTTKPAYPHIVERLRIVHQPYGRGSVVSVDRAHGYAGIRLDGEQTVRHVPLSRLAVEPRDMPRGIDDPMPFVRAPFRMPAPYRLIWPPSEGEVV